MNDPSPPMSGTSFQQMIRDDLKSIRAELLPKKEVSLKTAAEKRAENEAALDESMKAAGLSRKQRRAFKSDYDRAKRKSAPK